MTYPTHRRRPRTCEICSKTYVPTYGAQRTCGRECGVLLRFGEPYVSLRDLNAPTTAEREWLHKEKKRRLRAYVLERYHEDPDNWSTRHKRRRLFERDGWRCRICGTEVTDTVHRSHPKRAVAGHIVAKSTGGQWIDENMATLCHPCNVRDGVNRLPIQTSLLAGSF